MKILKDLLQLDCQAVHQEVARLEQSVRTSTESILHFRANKNSEKVGVGGAIVIGALLLELADNLMVGDNLTPGILVTRSGLSVSAAGFAGSRWTLAFLVIFKLHRIDDHSLLGSLISSQKL